MEKIDMSGAEKRKLEIDEEGDELHKKQASNNWAQSLNSTLANLGFLPVTEEEDIPQSKVGIVIGSKGAIIQEIMRRAQCKIIINQDFPEGAPRKIVYTGLPSNISTAKELIASVIAGGALALQSGSQPINLASSSDSVEIDCPPEKVGLVIGAKGMIIQDIMRRTGCKIVINQDFPEGVPRKIKFTGIPQQISDAQSLVYNIISKNNAGSDDKTIVTREIDCPQEKVGVIIGTKGVIIQEMMRRTGCKMVVNQDFPDGCPRKVLMTGTESQISAASQLVEAVIQQGPAAMHTTGPGLVTQDINIVQSQVGKVIGPGGTMIKDIQQRCGVKMVIEQEYTDSDERKIRVTGEPDRVQAAVQMVCQLLDPIGAASMAAAGMVASQSYGMNGAMPGYYPQGAPVAVPAAAPASTGVLALGADGTSGQLLPATTLPTGMQSQVALLKKTVAGKVIGKSGNVLNLIKQKSGASLVVEHSPESKNQLYQTQADPTQADMCRINITGYPQSISLAAQMIQEVLVNGAAKLQSMPDYVVPIEQQQQQQYYAQQAAYAAQYYQYYGQYAQAQAQYGYTGQAAASQTQYPVVAQQTTSYASYPSAAYAVPQATTYAAPTQAYATASVTTAAQPVPSNGLTQEQLYQQQYQQYYAQHYAQPQQTTAASVTNTATAGSTPVTGQGSGSENPASS